MLMFHLADFRDPITLPDSTKDWDDMASGNQVAAFSLLRELIATIPKGRGVNLTYLTDALTVPMDVVYIPTDINDNLILKGKNVGAVISPMRIPQ